jgi:hypothetical protein
LKGCRKTFYKRFFRAPVAAVAAAVPAAS